MIEALRRGARECAEQGINGWGNAMSEAADEIERLRFDNDCLKEACDKMAAEASDTRTETE